MAKAQKKPGAFSSDLATTPDYVGDSSPKGVIIATIWYNYTSKKIIFRVSYAPLFFPIDEWKCRLILQYRSELLLLQMEYLTHVRLRLMQQQLTDI